MSAIVTGAWDATAPISDEWSRHRAALFGALVSAHCDRLCKYAYHYVHSREAAEDVVYEVFATLWERGDMRNIRDPLPYLYRAVHNRAIRHLRRELVRQQWQARSLLEVPMAEAAHVETERMDLARALDRAIAGLPERRRQVFMMSREQNLSYDEIARILGLSVKTVKSHVWRALTMLRDQVTPYR